MEDEAGDGAAPLHHGAHAAHGGEDPVRHTVHVEVAVRANVKDLRLSQIGDAVKALLNPLREFVAGRIALPDDGMLRHVLDFIRIVTPPGVDRVPAWAASVAMNMFIMRNDAPEEETMDGEGAVTTLHSWSLPARQFDGLWDSLVFDEPIKERLLDYVSTALLFSKHRVDPDIVSCNRVLLLHGPPGTGKTTLCRALAHKLAIRMSDTYPSGSLLEINAHSLFSKWFSESGKLVMGLFSHIIEMVEEEDTFVCVLIDEVESLSAARSAAMAGSEPSDAIRVVNALLTQIDRLRTYENVVVLCTSNITGAIDVAFVDRADVKQFIGLPSAAARYEVARSCIHEMCRAQLLQAPAEFALPPFAALAAPLSSAPTLTLARHVAEAMQLAEGLSGRALRKLPFRAYAEFIRPGVRASPEQFVGALRRAVLAELADRSALERSTEANGRAGAAAAAGPREPGK